MDYGIRVALCKKKADEPNLTQSDLLKWLHDMYNVNVTQSTISNTLKRSKELLNQDIDHPSPTMDYGIRIALCKKKADEPNLTQSDLLKWLHDVYNIKVTQGTISNTLKRSKEILDQDIHRPNLNIKRYKAVKYPMMEDALYEWFTAHGKEVDLNGELMKQKAKDFLCKFYPDAKTFEFSNGWLQSFKKRHGIKLFRRRRERGSIVMVQPETELPRICKVLDQYKWEDIYNMDETGLFYRMQADNLLARKQLEGRKACKERITVVACCNGNGSNRLPLWVIGKFLNPRCLNNVNLENLGCVYRANTTASITVSLFLEWLKWFDSHMYGRNVILILDNCSAHVPLRDLLQLQNTHILFLPRNTSKIQPLQVGIIKNLKSCYRRRFNQKLLHALEFSLNPPTAHQINILEGIGMLVEAWEKDVKHSIIANCFHYCKIKSTTLQVDVTEDMLEDTDVMVKLKKQVHQLSYSSPMDINDLLNYPREDEVAYVPTELEIVEAIGSHSEESEGQKAASSEDFEDDSEELPKIKPNEVINMLSQCEGFFLQQNDSQEENIKKIRELIFVVQGIK